MIHDEINKFNCLLATKIDVNIITLQILKIVWNESLGPCIPNFYPKFWVEFWVGTSFCESRRDELNVIFSLFLVNANFRNSQKWKSQKNMIFCNFCAIFCKKLQFSQFSQVWKHSESTEITEIFPKFKKRRFPKLTKTKISEKNVFCRALRKSQFFYYP